MKHLTMQLETLACPACAKKIQMALQKAAGVASAEVLYNASKAKVQYDEIATQPEALKAVVYSLGYDVLKMR